MAGVKGKCGGPRINAGGARPNSGPQKAPLEYVDVPKQDDPKAFLLSVMNDPLSGAKLRMDAAKVLMAFVHSKASDSGKKAARQKDAESVAGRFAVSLPPRLVARGKA